jgi:hypothetical protein
MCVFLSKDSTNVSVDSKAFSDLLAFYLKLLLKFASPAVAENPAQSLRRGRSLTSVSR